MPKLKRGFTLIELLIVITIIGILAAFVVASFASATAKGRDVRRKADLDAVKKALELAKSDCPAGGYPGVIMGSNGMARYDNLKTYLLSLKYIKTMPDDPKDDNNTFQYRYTESENGAQSYTSNGCLDIGSGNWDSNPNYVLRATLENNNDSSGPSSFTKCSGRPGMPGSYTTPFYYVCND